jgi:hypothetical protein
MESVLFGSHTRWIGVLLAVFVVTSGVAVAQSDAGSDQPAWADEAFAEYEGMVAVYNESITSVDLGTAGDQLANERVNLVVTDDDGATATISFRMDSQLRMIDLQQGARSDATLRMSTDRGTFDDILAADNPAVAFRNAVTSGDITFDGLGTTNAVKWVVINTVANLARSLGLF